MASKKERIVVVSNREPYSVKLTLDGVAVQKNAGGLVSALEPMVKQSNGLWVCWEGEAGSKSQLFSVINGLSESEAESCLPFAVLPVALTDD